MAVHLPRKIDFSRYLASAKRGKIARALAGWPERRRKTAAITAGLAVVIAIMYLAFSEPSEKISYLTETVRKGDIVKTVNTTGEVAAGQLVSVGAQFSGLIHTLAVTLGHTVKKGDLNA
jgi:multidrug efflux pump subunit AcrA (membrane-fusion protein)